MKNVLLVIILLAAVGVGAWLIFGNQTTEPEFAAPQDTQLTETNMTLETSAFENNGSIPAMYTCDGNNISPPFQISGVPDKAVSLALIVDDPDVPTSIRPDGNWDHWLVWNIPAGTTSIQEGQEPNGVIGKNTGGNVGYQGPCPPDREHRYFFKLFALDAELDLNPETATKADIESAMEGHILSQTELMGRYSRQ